MYFACVGKQVLGNHFVARAQRGARSTCPSHAAGALCMFWESTLAHVQSVRARARVGGSADEWIGGSVGRSVGRSVGGSVGR